MTKMFLEFKKYYKSLLLPENTNLIFTGTA